MPDRKSIIAVNLPLKLFHAAVTNADTGSLKSIHTLFDTYLGHICKPNHGVRNVKNYEPFQEKPSFSKPFITKL